MAIERKQRNVIPEQDATIRSKNFDEVALGFDERSAIDEASRCLNCKNAPCMKGCPVGVRIPEFLAKVREGKFSEAGEIIKSTNSLPSVCGRVCPQEEQCEKMCVRAKIDGAVSIGGVERFIGDYMLSLPSENKEVIKTGKKVAVVGS
ncbi:MAG: dihydropyrimidine dehydrogenase, partial [Clostridia bacterium]|nr:dihydropyrimidine dehydrogenase [Clostridia bacterium]